MIGEDAEARFLATNAEVRRVTNVGLKDPTDAVGTDEDQDQVPSCEARL